MKKAGRQLSSQLNYSGVCAVHGATCLCNVTAVAEAVFSGSTVDNDAVR